jgi:cell division protein FtsL
MKYYQKTFRVQLSSLIKEKYNFEKNTGWFLTFVEVYNKADIWPGIYRRSNYKVEYKMDFIMSWKCDMFSLLYLVQLDIGAQLSLFLVCNFFSLFLILFLCYKTQCIVKKQYMLLFIAGDSCVIEWRNVQLHNQSESK